MCRGTVAHLVMAALSTLFPQPSPYSCMVHGRACRIYGLHTHPEQGKPC